MPENAADCVTPWRGIAYPDQLAKKRAAMLTVLQTLPKQMRAAQRSAEPAQRPRYDALSWLQPSRLAEHGGAPCALAEVVPSPRLKGYRNKCEFTIGKGADGNACVGYQLGKGKLGQTMVGAPTDCTNVPPEMLAAVAVIQEWLLRDGQLATFDKWGKGGVWRQIVARLAFASTVAADGAAAADAPPTLLLVVDAAVREGEGEENAAERAAVRAQVDALAAALQARPLAPPSTLSLALRVAEVRTHAGGQHIEKEDAVPLQPIFGPPHYEQPLCGLRFRVSPAAFFQVNVAAAEQLIALLRSQCGLSERTVLLDVCCGTGTIGLSMATAVRRVIGIELSDAAVADARANAALNEIDNATFLASKAEAAIKRVLTGLTAEDRQHLVAIVDPPRAGLHNDVVKALRACEPLARLLYVSCHAPGFVANAVQLCRPTSKAYAGAPFEPKHAWPLDLFPDTEHTELVVLLERPPPPPVFVAGQRVAPVPAAAEAAPPPAAEAEAPKEETA